MSPCTARLHVAAKMASPCQLAYARAALAIMFASHIVGSSNNIIGQHQRLASLELRP